MRGDRASGALRGSTALHTYAETGTATENYSQRSLHTNVSGGWRGGSGGRTEVARGAAVPHAAALYVRRENRTATTENYSQRRFTYE